MNLTETSDSSIAVTGLPLRGLGASRAALDEHLRRIFFCFPSHGYHSLLYCGRRYLWCKATCASGYPPSRSEDRSAWSGELLPVRCHFAFQDSDRRLASLKSISQQLRAAVCGSKFLFVQCLRCIHTRNTLPSCRLLAICAPPNTVYTRWYRSYGAGGRPTPTDCNPDRPPPMNTTNKSEYVSLRTHNTQQLPNDTGGVRGYNHN